MGQNNQDWGCVPPVSLSETIPDQGLYSMKFQFRQESDLTAFMITWDGMFIDV